MRKRICSNTFLSVYKYEIWKTIGSNNNHNKKERRCTPIEKLHTKKKKWRRFLCYFEWKWKKEEVKLSQGKELCERAMHKHTNDNDAIATTTANCVYVYHSNESISCCNHCTECISFSLTLCLTMSSSSSQRQFSDEGKITF